MSLFSQGLHPYVNSLLSETSRLLLQEDKVRGGAGGAFFHCGAAREPKMDRR
jgi:hypothetical protein